MGKITNSKKQLTIGSISNLPVTIAPSSGMQGIREFFDGATVLVTGGTGFLGKVLIEKILRSCPGVKRVYVLMRKRENDGGLEERMKRIFELPIFEKLKKDNPNALQKVKVVRGNIAAPRLGLNDEDWTMLVQNTNVIYHAASCVDFNQSFKDAVLTNTRAAREVCELALQMKKIKVMLYVSAAHSQMNKAIVEETTYKAQGNWKHAIKIAEQLDPNLLDVIAPIYADNYPNNYTFSKSLAENVVEDMLGGKVPNVILRPTLLTASFKEPIPGWLEGCGGFAGSLLAGGSGLMRTVYIHEMKTDFIPVDYAVKGILMSTWNKAVKNKTKDTTVYNCGSLGLFSVQTNEMVHINQELTWEQPWKNCVWYPNVSTTDNFRLYYIYTMLFHFIPALFIDLFLKITGNKTMILSMQRHTYKMTLKLKHYLETDFTFENINFYALGSETLERDREEFCYDISEFQVHDYFKRVMKGAKRYLLKEKDEDSEASRSKLKILYRLHMVIRAVLIYSVYYLFFYRYNVIVSFYRWFKVYWQSL